VFCMVEGKDFNVWGNKQGKPVQNTGNSNIEPPANPPRAKRFTQREIKAAKGKLLTFAMVLGTTGIVLNRPSQFLEKPSLQVILAGAPQESPPLFAHPVHTSTSAFTDTTVSTPPLPVSHKTAEIRQFCSDCLSLSEPEIHQINSWDNVWDTMKNDPAYRSATLYPVYSNFSPEISSIIIGKSIKHGYGHTLLGNMAYIESKGDPNAEHINHKTHRIGAIGLWQFTEDTANSMRLKNRKDPIKSTDCELQLLDEYKTYLTKHLHRKPSDPELYLAHQQGAKGAYVLITAAEEEKEYKKKIAQNPNNPSLKNYKVFTAIEVLEKADVGNAEEHITGNGGKIGWTAFDFVSHWEKEYEKIGKEKTKQTSLLEHRRSR
jgi:hypothetical protein